MNHKLMIIWEYIKMKIFCSLKDKMKKQATDWEKIFTNHISDKRLVSKIHKEFLKLYTKKMDSMINILN